MNTNNILWYHTHMKYLGIDYGAKRIGLAISDSGGQVATAYAILENDNTFLPLFAEIIEKEGVQSLVVGKSHDLQGNANTIQKHIDVFIEVCEKKFNIPVHAHWEAFSSMQAKWGVTKSVRRVIKSNRIEMNTKSPRHIDAGAAVVVLQNFLDKQN